MNLYLLFNGNCEEAMNFYTKATGGSITMLTRFSDAPMPHADEDKNRIMHGIMTIQGATVMCSDGSSKHNVNFGDNFSIALDFTNEAEMDNCFNMLSDGGKATMPLADSFWGARFGMCTDKFGNNWMFNMDKPKA
jgi:PhnB protein